MASTSMSDVSIVCSDKSQRTSQFKVMYNELDKFVTGSSKHAKVRSSEVANAAIYLLRHGMGFTDAVLEHFSNLFEESVNTYVLNLELEGTENLNENIAADETIIQEIQKVLTELIVRDPETWAPLISLWSLSLLGKLGSKYADRRVVPSPTNLQDLLQFWNNCRPTRTLIELTRECLSTLVNSNPDSCIDALIETSVYHSPHFDWVVAHIGSCFPMTVISRVLACGLKDFFCLHDTAEDQQLNRCPKVPKIASVVGILGHLATKHHLDMKTAIRSLFYESMSDSATREQLATGPFLLHLASMSDILSDIISSEFVGLITPETLNMMSRQVEKWKIAKIPKIDGLVNVVVHLLLRSEGGSQVVRRLLDIIPPSSINMHAVIRDTVGLILDSVLVEVQRRVYMTNTDIPLLHFLKKHVADLSIKLSETEGSKATWVFNILKLVCVHGGEQFTTFVLGHILSNRENVTACLSSFIQEIQLSQPNALCQTISRQVAELKSRRIKKPAILLKNIISLCQIMQLKSLVIDGVIPNLEGLADLVSEKDLEFSDALIELMSITVIPEQMPISSLFKVGSSSCNYFFHLFFRDNITVLKKIHLVEIVRHLLMTLCKQSAAQNLILRMLVEGTIDEKFAKFFGGKYSIVEESKSTSADFSLLNENAKSTSSMLLPPNHCSIFYSGVVGSGLRTVPRLKPLPEETVVLNKQLFLDTLRSCCKISWRFPLDDVPNAQSESLIPGMKIVALMMVELISPDVMFNGLPWPDEEYLKITIERDLCIKQKFESHPILWDLLFLVATVHPSLCYCSVLLRAVMAVLISYWGSNQSSATTHSPKQLKMTQTLIHVMAIGQLLPKPLSYIDEVLPLICPQDAYIVLSDVWQYMRDNVPSPALFSTKDSTSLQMWRNFDSDESGHCDRKYTKKLRYIMFEHIEKFGSVYAKFFPMKQNPPKLNLIP